MSSSHEQQSDEAPRQWLGRYALFDEIGSGGMASVRLARLQGADEFSKVVAVKLLHRALGDHDAGAVLKDEARVLSRIRHGNVVSVLDFVSSKDQVALVMEYVPGEALSLLLPLLRQRKERMAPEIAVAIVKDVLRGLQAAHTAKGEAGEPLGLVHRDVSPQNILVGAEGIARIVDFGIAKAQGRLQVTQESSWKGKPSYMAPEQLRDCPVDCRTDLWGISVVLWECLTGCRLFQGDTAVVVARKVLEKPIDPPSRIVPSLPASIDEVVLRGLSRDPEARSSSAASLAEELVRAIPPAPCERVKAWLSDLAGESLAKREALVAEIERAPLQQSVPVRVGSGAATSRGRSLLLAGIAIVVIGGAVIALRLSRNSTTAEQQSPPAVASIPLSAPRTASAEIPLMSPSSLSGYPSAGPALRGSSSSSARPFVLPVASGSSKPKSKAVNCDPPYVVDPEGFLKVKSECL